MAEQTGKYSWLYQVLGANKVVSENKRVARSMRGVQQAARGLASGLMGMRASLAGAMGGLVALGLAVRRSVNDYGRYTMALARVRTTLAAQTENYRQNQQLVTSLSDAVGRNLGYSLTESNDAMMTMLQTGLGMHRSMRIYGTSMQLARVAGMDTSRATQFLTDTMRMFREEAAESGEEVQHFARRVSTQLSVSANMASTNIEQLQQAFRYAGGPMAAMGYESGEVMASLAGLSSMGLRGSIAGTGLRRAMVKLLRPTRNTYAEFEQLGIRGEVLTGIIRDANGGIRPLGESMSRLTDVIRRMPDRHRQLQALSSLFGLRGMAAGTALAGLTEGGERMTAIMERLRDSDVREGTILDRQSEEQMRSFGMQMQQLNHGLTDLAIGFGEILFGAMETGRRGFGTYVREVAAGIRLVQAGSRRTADQRREWEALSPEVREASERYHTLFVNLTDVLKVMGQLARGLMWVVQNYPQVVVGLVAMRIAFGGLTASATGATAALARIGGMSTFTAGAAVPASRGISMLRGAFVLLGIEVAGRATTALQNYFIAQRNMGHEMEQIRRNTVATHAATARAIPIVGHLAAQYIELAGAIQAAWQEHDRMTQRQEDQARREFGGAEAQVEARYQRMRGSSLDQYRGRSDQELRSMAAMQERQSSMVRMSTLLYARGIRSQEGVASYLQRQGQMEGAQAARVAAEITRLQRPMAARGDASVRSEAAAMTAGMGAWTERGRLEQGLRATSTQLTGLDGAANRARDALEGLALGIDTGTAGDQQSVPSMEDGYVRRGGLARVATDDVVVSRQHMADAVSARRGSMVGPILGSNQLTGPAPTTTGGGSGGGGGDIVIQIDGREVARAVGAQHVTHMERSGSNLQPGVRRTMRETGFSERLG